MFDMLSSRHPHLAAPALEPEDREFLAGAPVPEKQQQHHQSDRPPHVDDHHVAPRVWSSSSFSSFSSSGGAPPVRTTTERRYDSDSGEVREVRRRSVGDQLVVEHRVHCHGDDGEPGEVSSTRRLHNIDEAHMAEFESHFTRPQRDDRTTLQLPNGTPAPDPTPPPPPSPPEPLEVSSEDVAALHRVVPDMSESDVTGLLRQHHGNLRAAMRAVL